MEYSIREAGLSDIQTIRDIADIAFRATYASIISPGQIDYMLDWMYSEDTLARELSSGVSYLLLLTAGRPVAYVSFGPETNPETNPGTKLEPNPETKLETESETNPEPNPQNDHQTNPQPSGLYHLHKIYVLPEFQYCGFGRALFVAAEAYMRERGAAAFELNVNRNNRALGFYERMGMHISRSGDFDIGNGFFMNDYIMNKAL